jgi:hypothetical protein
MLKKYGSIDYENCFKKGNLKSIITDLKKTESFINKYS